MIVSFGDRETEKVWNGERSRRLPLDIQAVALRKLRLISAAKRLDDLRMPPGNRLERLKDDRAGQWARRRDLASDLRDVLVKMGPNTEMIGHIRKYVEHLGSIHAVFRKLVDTEEKRWEKIMRDAMNHVHRPPDIKGLPLVVYATKKDSSGLEIQLFEAFFDSLELLRRKNGTQQTLSKRYVRWSGLPPE